MKSFKDFFIGLIIVCLCVVGVKWYMNDYMDKEEKDKSVICMEQIPKEDFIGEQMKYKKVQIAWRERGEVLRKKFDNKNISYPAKQIFFRAFKKEKELQLWARSSENEPFTYIKSYDFTKLSGKFGPKRKEGDLQVPEGFYYINRFNPTSKFYLSLGINYPNKSDKILGHKEKPGSDIFIHGGSASVGCIPVGDEMIKEIYLLAVEAKSDGMEKIPVYIFPTKMDDKNFNKFKAKYNDNKELIDFWENIKVGADIFEKTHYLPKVDINEKGKYIFVK